MSEQITNDGLLGEMFQVHRDDAAVWAILSTEIALETWPDFAPEHRRLT